MGDLPTIDESARQNDVLRKLNVCAQSLQSLELSDSNKRKLKGFAVQLSGDFFILHQSKEVKILTACCIADLLRIFAPDAPYVEERVMETVLSFLIRQLRGLDNPKDAFYKRYYYLLENLCCVRSLELIYESENSETLLNDVFGVIFHVVVAHGDSDRLFELTRDLLVPLLVEPSSIPESLLDRIFLQLLEPKKTQDRSAYKLAKSLLQKCENHLEASVQAFLNNLIFDDNNESEVQEQRFELIYELQQVSPFLLNPVLPQLEVKLSSTDDEERKKCVAMLGKLFALPAHDMFTDYPTLWAAYLRRFVDTNVDIRKRCVRISAELIKSHKQAAASLRENLINRLHDFDETVRFEVISTIRTVCKLDDSFATLELLHGLGERTMDKKFKIRREALSCLANMYKQARERLDEDDQDDVAYKRVAWVKNKIMYLYYQNTLEDRLFVEKLVTVCLVPYNFESKRKAKWLHELYCSFDDRAMKAFNQIIKNQFSIRQCLKTILEYHKEEESTERDNKICQKLQTISEHFKIFYDSILCEDEKSLKLFDAIVSAENYKCSDMEIKVNELLARVEIVDKQRGIKLTIKSLLERCAPLIFDKDTVFATMGHVTDALNGSLEYAGVTSENMEHRSLALLNNLSVAFSYLFCSDAVVKLLIGYCRRIEPSPGDFAMKILYNMGKHTIEQCPRMKGPLLTLFKELVETGSLKQARYAVRCTQLIFPDQCSQLHHTWIDEAKEHIDMEDDSFARHMHVIGEIALLDFGPFQKDLKNIMKSVAGDVLLKNFPEHSCDHDEDENWCNRDDLCVEAKNKIAALKFTARLLVSLTNNQKLPEVNKSLSERCINALMALVETRGVLQTADNLCKVEASHFYVSAACGMLRVLRNRYYVAKLPVPKYQLLMFTLCDDHPEVRRIFATKLNYQLMIPRLPLQYMAGLCVAALVPIQKPSKEAEQYKKNIRIMLCNNIVTRRNLMKRTKQAQANSHMYLPEYCLCFAVHLLAHHKSLQSYEDVATLNSLKEALWFLMEPLTNAKYSEHFSFQFLYKLFQDVKQTRDALDPKSDESAKKLWALSDIGITLVSHRLNNFVLRDHPYKSMLDMRFFTDPNRTYNNTEIYAPNEVLEVEFKRKKQLAAARKRPGLTGSGRVAGEASTPQDESKVKSKRRLDGKVKRPVVKQVRGQSKLKLSKGAAGTSTARKSPVKKQRVETNTSGLEVEDMSDSAEDEVIQAAVPTRLPPKRGAKFVPQTVYVGDSTDGEEEEERIESDREEAILFEAPHVSPPKLKLPSKKKVAPKASIVTSPGPSSDKQSTVKSPPNPQAKPGTRTSPRKANANSKAPKESKLAPRESVSKSAPKESISKSAPKESVSKLAPKESISKSAPKESVSKLAPKESISKSNGVEAESDNSESDSENDTNLDIVSDISDIEVSAPSKISEPKSKSVVISRQNTTKQSITIGSTLVLNYSESVDDKKETIRELSSSPVLSGSRSSKGLVRTDEAASSSRSMLAESIEDVSVSTSRHSISKPLSTKKTSRAKATIASRDVGQDDSGSDSDTFTTDSGEEEHNSSPVKKPGPSSSKSTPSPAKQRKVQRRLDIEVVKQMVRSEARLDEYVDPPDEESDDDEQEIGSPNDKLLSSPGSSVSSPRPELTLVAATTTKKQSIGIKPKTKKQSMATRRIMSRNRK